MPLNDLSSNPFTHSFRDRETHEPISRRSTPIHSANESRARRDSVTSNHDRVSNPLDAKDVAQVERQKKLQDLKLEVPDTTEARPTTSGKHFPVRGGWNNAQSETRGRNVQEKAYQRHESVFDDTESFDDESSFQEENHTTIYRGIPIEIPVEYVQEKAQAEREYQDRREVNHRPQVQPRFNPQKFNNYKQLVEEQQTINDTPSRSRTTSSTRPLQAPQAIKNVSFDSAVRAEDAEREDSPELEIPRSQVVLQPVSSVLKHTDTRARLLNRSQPSWDEQPLRQPFSRSLVERHQEHQSIEPQPIANPTDSFRASDCPTSSEDENPLVQSKSPIPAPVVPGNEQPTRRKRERDLDYEVDVLKNMKFEDLNSQLFSDDPTDTSKPNAFDSQGNAMTLSQRLNNLDKMNEEEQKIMFRTQNDDEWAQMGSWFINRFQEDLQKLMNVRLERRKVSMRFENEIRRRQTDVDWHYTGVEDELKELKKGGGELIKGRDASTKGTPLRK